jgi:hypothetical protein
MTKRQTRKPTPVDTAPAATAQPAERDPELQGEGNYTAARRHRKSVERFVDAGKVERAAHDAAPRSEGEARELREAEDAGRAHARK